MTKLSEFLDHLPASGRSALAVAGILATLATAQAASANQYDGNSRTWAADTVPFIAKLDERVTSNLRSLVDIVHHLKRIPFGRGGQSGDQMAHAIQVDYVNAVNRAPYPQLAEFDHFHMEAQRGVPDEGRIERIAEQVNGKREVLLEALDIVDRMDKALAYQDFNGAEELLMQANQYLDQNAGSLRGNRRDSYAEIDQPYGTQQRQTYGVQQNVYQQNNIYQQQAPYYRHESFKHRIEDALINSLNR